MWTRRGPLDSKSVNLLTRGKRHWTRPSEHSHDLMARWPTWQAKMLRLRSAGSMPTKFAKLHLHGEEDHERLVDCTFIARHRPADSVSVILYGTYVERCRFEEAGLADVAYIWHGNTHIGPGVTVAGPHLVWHPDKNRTLTL